MQIPLAVPQEAIASATPRTSSQDVGEASAGTDTVRPVLKTKKKRFEIIGVRLLSIQCNERNYIRLGRSLDEDLGAFAGSSLRDFYENFGEKVSYVIVVGPPIVRLLSCVAQHLGISSSRMAFATRSKCAVVRTGTAKAQCSTLPMNVSSATSPK